MTAFEGRFLVGVNYWSRAGGPRMWDRFDERIVRVELEQLKSVGIDCIRCFAFVPSFMPHPPAVEESMLARLKRFGELATEVGVDLLPTSLVGHMSGENWDFPGYRRDAARFAREEGSPGQRGRPLYTDGELLDWQVALVDAVTRTLADCPAVKGWILSNEMPLWAGAGTPDEVRPWLERLTATIRQSSSLPIGTGDGVMTTFPTRAAAPLVDYLAPHVYYGDVDPLRQAFQIDLTLAQVRPLQKPLLLEEFGCSSNQAGEPEQAAYYREAFATAFATGARGALGWCFSDFDAQTIGREPPYSHHAFELGFGVTRADGSEKPVCDELRAYRRLVDALPMGEVRALPTQTAIVRPRYLDEDFPFSWQDREAMRRTLLQAFVLASQAGLDPVILAEGDDLSPYRLILLPSTQKLLTPTWLALEAAARDGATVYWSYFSGDHTFHQAPWCANFSSLTGLRHRLRYGCFDLPAERFVVKGPVPLSIPTQLAHSPAPQSLSRIPVEVGDASTVSVLAHDGDGRPALYRHELGRGRVLFCTHPLERYLANLVDGSSRDGHRFYRLLADEAGLEPPYQTRHPDVQSRVLDTPEHRLVVVQHRGWTASVDDATEVPRDAEVLFDRGNPGPHALGPKGVRIYRFKRER